MQIRYSTGHVILKYWTNIGSNETKHPVFPSLLFYFSTDFTTYFVFYNRNLYFPQISLLEGETNECL